MDSPREKTIFFSREIPILLKKRFFSLFIAKICLNQRLCLNAIEAMLKCHRDDA
jgi:hypothetical protein